MKTKEEISNESEVKNYEDLEDALKGYKATGRKVIRESEYRAQVVDIDKEKGIKHVTDIIADEYYFSI